MKIIFFVNKVKKSATARFRGYLISKCMNKSIPSKVIKVDEIYNRYNFNFIKIKKFLKYFKIVNKTKKNDILYLVKTVYNIDFLIVILISKYILKKKIIFDFDDTIYLKPFTKLSTKILTRISDAVIVGSNQLLKWTEKRNNKTFKIPTSVPHEVYRGKMNKKNKIFTIGWIGNGKNHLKNLKILKPVFEKLIKSKFEFKFKLIGLANNKELLNFFKSINNLKFIYKNNIKWENVNSSVIELKTFDLGIMPLVRDEKTLGKCAFKIIEYMAAGVPVIASSVGENKIVIKNKIDGFLVSNEKDWFNKIVFLKKNVSLKNKIIKNAMEKVQNKYSNVSNVMKLEKIFKNI